MSEIQDTVRRWMMPLFPVLICCLQPCIEAADLAGDGAGVQRLYDDLKQGDWILRTAALKRLADMKQADAVGPILGLLETCTNEWMQGQALIALACIQPQEVPGHVGPLLASQHTDARMLGLRALELCRQRDALETVKAARGDADPVVRWTARAAQAAIEGEAAWDEMQAVLTRLSDAEEGSAIREIVRALAYVGTDAALARITLLLDRHLADGRAPDLIRGLGDVHDPRLISLLIHVQQVVGRNDPVSTGLCLRALSRYAEDQLKNVIVAIVGAPLSGDLSAAVRTAGELCPSPELGERIATCVTERSDSDPAVLLACLEALSSPGMDPSRHTALYSRCLHSADAEIRKAAARCLAKCEGVEVFALLAPALRDESPDVRRAALAAIAEVPRLRTPPDVATYLREFLRSPDRELYEQGLKVLVADAREEQFASVLAALKDELGGANVERRDAAARAASDFVGMNRMFEIARPQGYIVDWMVIGAFPSDKANAGFRETLPPEREIDFARVYRTQYEWIGEGRDGNKPLETDIRWQRSSLVLADGMLSLTYLMPPTRYGVCYAVADVQSDVARTVAATVSADNCAAVWVNDKELARIEPSEMLEEAVVTREVPVPLRAGVNRVMLKVANLGGGWSVGVRFHDATGAAILLPSAFPEEGGTQP